MATTTAERRPVIQPRKAVRRHFAHFKNPLNDSYAGLLLAVKLGYRWIDLNSHVTVDGHLVFIHDGRPLRRGWKDPKGELHRDTLVWNMTLEEVTRLRHPSGARVHTVGWMLEQCVRLGLHVEFEAKNSPQFTRPEPWERLKHYQRETGAVIVVKTISNLGNGPARLQAAHNQGFSTMLLPRGTRRVSKSWWPYITCVRGPVRWVG